MEGGKDNIFILNVYSMQQGLQKGPDSTPEQADKSMSMSCAHLYKTNCVAELNTLSHSAIDPVAQAQAQACNTADLWHSRLGHPAKSTVQHQCKTCTGLPDFKSLECSYALPCQHCLAGRCPASSHPPIGVHASTPCEYIYCDLTGPYKKSWNGCQYTLNMVDHCTGYAYSVCMADKQATAAHLGVGIDRLQQLSGHTVKNIRSDCGSEFFNTDVLHMLGDRHINYSTTIPYTPQQNGIVERYNRSVMEITRSLLSASGRSSNLWSHAYTTACYLYNRRVSVGRSSEVTRFEAFTGKKPDLSRLKVWGCKVFVRVQIPTSKLDARAVAGLFMGYDEYSHGYMVKVGGGVYVREDIIFSETELGRNTDVDLTGTPALPISPLLPTDTTPAPAATHGPSLHSDSHFEVPMQDPISDPIFDVDLQEFRENKPKVKKKKQQRVYEPHSPALHTRQHDLPMHSVHMTTALHAALRDGYVYKPVVFENPPIDGIVLHSPAPCMTMPFAMNEFHDATVLAAAVQLPNPKTHKCLAEQEVNKNPPPFPEVVVGLPLPLPTTVREAQKSPYWDHWHKAIQDEYNSMQELSVFELVHLPPGSHVLTCKWVFAWKVTNGVVTRAKGRIVARGFQQREDEYSELYSPTIHQDTLRILMSYSAQTGAYVHQLDVKTAFLYGSLDEEIYMKCPDGCEDTQGRVWRLLKSLYGLKQAPRAWYTKLKGELNKLGFESSWDDQALFFKGQGSDRVFLCVHVDDMLIIHPDKQKVLDVVTELKKVFTISDLGEVSNYLGMSIKKLSPHSFFLYQPEYTTELLHKYFDKTALTARQLFGTTPLPYDFIFRKLDSEYATGADDCIPCDVQLYQQIVGKLMWLANVSRPDILWAVNQCARYNQHPSVAHYKATQYICRYLHATHDYGLLFEKCESAPICPLVGYCDASHQSCCDTARSCTGMAFLMGSTVVACQSKMQKTVALSTAESEYMSISSTSKAAVWLNRIYSDVTSMQDTTDVYVGEIVPPCRSDTTSKQVAQIKQAQLIYNDNQSAISMVHNDQSTKLTKHIAKIHHFAREQVAAGVVDFKHIDGTKNVSDIFTKWLPLEPFRRHRYSLGLRSFADLSKTKT